jgi:hypothetical protein
MANGQLYAVLTGDLVKSSRLTSAQSTMAMDWLRRAADEFADVHKASILGQIDTFRHDSWQLLLARSEFAIRAAVYLRAALKLQSDATTKYDTRISIGVGTVESISKLRISDSRGIAFTLSGKGLDLMEGHRMALSHEDEESAAGQWIGRCVIPLLDCIVSDWTPAEAKAICGAIKGWTQEQSAEKWGKNERIGKNPTRQAVGKSLDRAHWGMVEDVLSWVEKEKRQPVEVALA